MDYWSSIFEVVCGDLIACVQTIRANTVGARAMVYERRLDGYRIDQKRCSQQLSSAVSTASRLAGGVDFAWRLDIDRRGILRMGFALESDRVEYD